MHIIPHLNLRLPFRPHKASPPSPSQSGTTLVSGHRVTPDPDSKMAPPDPNLEALFADSNLPIPQEKQQWEIYMETYLSRDTLEEANKIELGILRIIHKMLSAPAYDNQAAKVATQEVKDFYSHLYKKRVTQDELLANGGNRVIRLEDGDYRGAGYFLENAAGFVLEMAHLIDVGDVNHGRIFYFLEGFRGPVERKVVFFDHKNPKFIYDPKAIGRAAKVVWEYTCPSVRSGINPSREECDGRMAFSALLARLVGAELVPHKHTELLAYDIDLALCPEVFERAEGRVNVQPRQRQPAEFILRAREAIAARHIIIAGPVLCANIPDSKWKMWFYRMGRVSLLARDRAEKAELQLDSFGSSYLDGEENMLGGEELLGDDGLGMAGLFGDFGITSDAELDTQTLKGKDKVEDEDEEVREEVFCNQQRDIQLDMLAQTACGRLRNLWPEAIGDVLEEIVIGGSSDDEDTSDDSDSDYDMGFDGTAGGVVAAPPAGFSQRPPPPPPPPAGFAAPPGGFLALPQGFFAPPPAGVTTRAERERDADDERAGSVKKRKVEGSSAAAEASPGFLAPPVGFLALPGGFPTMPQGFSAGPSGGMPPAPPGFFDGLVVDDLEGLKAWMEGDDEDVEMR